MIQANELILGNLIRYRDEKDCIVSSLGANGFETVNTYNGLPNGSSDLWEYNPIPLTEEWLVRFGFTKRKFSYLWGYGNFLYDERLKLWTWYGIQLHDYLIDSVHKLQNLHFALTGEELKLNDK